MPHLHRFFVDSPAAVQDRHELSGAELHHALHVVRVKAGEEVALFDGAGHEWRGIVGIVSKRSVVIDITSSHSEARPDRSLTLVQGAVVNAKSTEAIIQRCTELGVERIIFFRADRSERAPRERDKWRRIAIEASKQCGRMWLPEMETAGSLREALVRRRGIVLVATLLAPPRPLREVLSGHKHATVVVGPEGDLTEGEVFFALGEAGGTAISLGTAILRSEVAAATVCALIHYEFGTLGPAE